MEIVFGFILLNIFFISIDNWNTRIYKEENKIADQEVTAQIEITKNRSNKISEFINMYKDEDIYREIALAIEFGIQHEKEVNKIKEVPALEEVAKENALNQLKYFEPTKENFKLACKRSYIKGVKWQQESSYSEEEVLNLLQDFADEDFSNVTNIKKWFEQFKKK